MTISDISMVAIRLSFHLMESQGKLGMVLIALELGGHHQIKGPDLCN